MHLPVEPGSCLFGPPGGPKAALFSSCLPQEAELSAPGPKAAAWHPKSTPLPYYGW